MATHDESAELRKRFTIPPQDESVLEWVNEQISLSASLRLVIREWIERHGYGDATCLPVAKLPPRGRPPRAVSEADDEALADLEVEAPTDADTAPETEPDADADVPAEAEPDSEPSDDGDSPPDMDTLFAANRR